MLDSVLWALALALHFARLCPPLASSWEPVPRQMRLLLTSALGGCLGFGFGRALAELLVK